MGFSFFLKSFFFFYFYSAGCRLRSTDVGYANLLGLSTDLKLVGTQYALLSTVLSAVQLGWQPVSSYFLVRVKPRILMTALVFCWGAIETGFGGASSWSTLMPLRAFLGLFEAGCKLYD
jgi:hypothetical protein